MADSTVSVNIAGGATAPVDTFTQPGGDHRQAVVLGDAAAAQTAAVDTAGRLAVRNPVSSAATVAPVVLTAATSATLLTANTARLFGSVYNPLTTDLLIALAATASAASYTVLVPPLGYFELPPSYTGAVAGYSTGAGTVYATAVS